MGKCACPHNLKEVMQNLLVHYPLQQRHVFRDNPALKTIPEFARCSALEMCFVILMADYFSPLRHLRYDEYGNKVENGEHLQRVEAVREAGYCNTRSVSRGLTPQGRLYVRKEKKHVEDAIQMYQKIQRYDELEMLFDLKDTYMAYNKRKVDEIKDMNKHVKNSLEIIKQKAGLDMVNERIREHIAALPRFSEISKEEAQEHVEDVNLFDPDA